ncbi:MAG TPA: hypothetical protein VG733_05665 [Chthoniobacteraceae bacterium]|nr:hypothetical protein [Chthoniobacteraceae bacterium]
MKKFTLTMLAAAALLFCMAPNSNAGPGVHFGVVIGAPVYPAYYPPYYYGPGPYYGYYGPGVYWHGGHRYYRRGFRRW